VAAGRGTRAGADVPKQYALLAGEPLLAHTLRAFVTHPAIDAIQVVIGPGDEALYQTAAARFGGRLAPPITGGTTRQQSVLNGLVALQDRQPARVVVHDAARPFLDAAVIDRVLAALGVSPAAIAAEPLADTLKRASPRMTVAETIDRRGLWRAQTPQGFAFEAILEAHRRAAAAGLTEFTDDAALAEWAGLDVALVEGSPRNIKLTTAEDLVLAERVLAPCPAPLEPRIGSGFDVHRFAPGDGVWLCGVFVPHEARLEGHSDADVGLHAVTDAILGALGEGDIGAHFPPSDPRWRGADSRIFAEDAAKRVRARGGRIVNVDVTLLCEAPRIGPHREAMRAAIADMLAISAARVGVKATTTEGLGFTGRREGIAALASAMLLLPAGPDADGRAD
jgi:2-C-methyl-D-erythritol 4-phosphate cytidylyltransferase/2-C-methyl-D-erythritol 2,4-cyclodiphosphate synthase